MVYRIRYRCGEASCEAETVVEANTPTEALVKFNHTRDCCGVPGRGGDVVTSICAHEDRDEMFW